LPDGESDEVVGEDMDGEFLLDHVGVLHRSTSIRMEVLMSRRNSSASHRRR
jgi:hypothetical protein